jgi:hypothetical protein
LVSFSTCVPQWRCDLGSSSEQTVGRAADHARDGGQQQRFWTALMVLITAPPARLLRRLELSEHSLISHVDICRSLNPCLQAILYLESNGTA